MSCGVSRDCAEVLLRLLAIGLSNGAVLALNAIGVTLVYGVVRTINFAHGDLFALLSVVAAWTISLLGLEPGLSLAALAGGLLAALLVTGGAGALLNAAIERLAFRPFRGRSRVAPLIATIGLSFVLYQVALGMRFLTNAYIPGEHRSVPGIPELPRFRIPDLLPDTNLAPLLGLGANLSLPLRDALMPLCALLLAALVGWFLEATRLGRALRACAQDPEMAQLCGVDRDGAIRLAFGVGGALAGVAALIFALYYTHPMTVYGAQSGLLAFTAAVLGGIGRPRGALLAGLLLGVVAALSDYFLAAQWTPVLMLALLMALLLVRPTGLAAEGAEEGSTTDDRPPATDRRPRAADRRRPFAQLPHFLRPLGARRSSLVGPALLALGLAYPLLDELLGLRITVLVTGMLVFALLALGLNLLLGFAGLLDLGYAAAFGLGAYAAGLLTSIGGPLDALLPPRMEFGAVLLAGAVVAGLFGVLNALVTFRLRGEYLAIVTLAFGQMVPQILLNLKRATGGAAGISALPPPVLLGLPLTTPNARYYLALCLVVLTAIACVRLRGSRIGRAWRAMSSDETAAAFCGVDVRRARLLAFVLGGAVAGAAGALFASVFSYVDPAQSELRVSAMVLAMVVIGGVGSIPGAILGALGVASLDQLAVPLAGAWMQRAAEGSGLWWLAALDPRNYNYMAFGLALYLATRFRQRAGREAQ
jgi:branched-chain amino acid transport system permease protein